MRKKLPDVLSPLTELVKESYLSTHNPPSPLNAYLLGVSIGSLSASMSQAQILKVVRKAISDSAPGRAPNSGD